MKLSEYFEAFFFYCCVFLLSSTLNTAGTFTSAWIKKDTCDFNTLFGGCCSCHAKEENITNIDTTTRKVYVECLFDKSTSQTDIFPELEKCFIMVKYLGAPLGLQLAAWVCYVTSAFGFFIAIFTDTTNISNRRIMSVLAVIFALYHLAGLLSLLGCIVLSVLHPDATMGYSFYLCVASSTYTVIQIILFWTVVTCHLIDEADLSSTSSTDEPTERPTRSDIHGPQGRDAIWNCSFADIEGIGDAVDASSVSPTGTNHQQVSMAGAQVHVSVYAKLTSRLFSSVRSNSAS